MATLTKPKKRRRKLHGTEGEYRRGCRCEKCRAASRAARADRASRRGAKQHAADLKERERAANAVAPVAREVFSLEPELWKEYGEAVLAQRAAELRRRELEVAIKEAMGPAVLLRVAGRTVATWQLRHTKEHTVAARSSRIFLPLFVSPYLKGRKA